MVATAGSMAETREAEAMALGAVVGAATGRAEAATERVAAVVVDQVVNGVLVWAIVVVTAVAPRAGAVE